MAVSQLAEETVEDLVSQLAKETVKDLVSQRSNGEDARKTTPRDKMIDPRQIQEWSSGL